MRNTFLLLLLCPALWADNIPPTITKDITTSGDGMASGGGFVNVNGTDFAASISGNVQVYYPTGSAVADVSLEGEFIAQGTGFGLLNYSGSGSAGGSANGGFANASFELASVTSVCTQQFGCFGLTPGGASTSIQLGVPFYLDMTGNASASVTNGNEDAGANYGINLDFDVTQNGAPVPLTEIAIPGSTPEPGTVGLAGCSIGLALLIAGIRHTRRIAGNAKSLTHRPPASHSLPI